MTCFNIETSNDVPPFVGRAAPRASPSGHPVRQGLS